MKVPYNSLGFQGYALCGLNLTFLRRSANKIRNNGSLMTLTAVRGKTSINISAFAMKFDQRKTSSTSYENFQNSMLSIRINTQHPSHFLITRVTGLLCLGAFSWTTLSLCYYSVWKVLQSTKLSALRVTSSTPRISTSLSTSMHKWLRRFHCWHNSIHDETGGMENMKGLLYPVKALLF